MEDHITSGKRAYLLIQCTVDRDNIFWEVYCTIHVHVHVPGSLYVHIIITNYRNYITSMSDLKPLLKTFTVTEDINQKINIWQSETKF